MKNILISVITPCFNSEKTIEKTLQSVLNQTYQNFEYIIIDGGSTDDTLKIIESYKEKFAEKLTVVSEKDNGIYDAMNKGIRLAKGELVGIINSDDFYELTALNDVVEEYQNEKYAVIYGMMKKYNQEKVCSVLFYHHDFLKEQMINHPTCFVTKALYNDLGVYNLDYKSAADYDFMLRISDNKEVIFKPIYRIISNFADGGMSSSFVNVEESIELWYKYGTFSKKMYWLKKTYIKGLKVLSALGIK